MAADIEVLTRRPQMSAALLRAAIHRGGSSASLPATALSLAAQRVDRGNLGDYQRLCGFAVDDTLPHTYPHILGFPLQMELMSRKGFPLPLVGLVHLGNTITVKQALTADDQLNIVVSADNLRDHAKGRLVDLVTEVTIDGESVWSGASTYLSRGRSNPGADRGPKPGPMPTGVAAAKWSLPSDLGRQYAAVSGDINPIHLSTLSAKALGFPKAIAHGMWTYARVLGALGRASSGPSTSTVWFAKPVLLPGKVDLLVDKSGDEVVAGLRSSRKPDVTHLTLTLAA